MKVCKYCAEPIEKWAHGNRNYCSDECYMAAKLDRQNEKYAAAKGRLQYVRRSEAILEELFNTYGPNQYISALLLEERKFDFNLSEGIRVVEGGRATIVGKYYYLLFTNQTIRIWKI